MAQRTLRPSLFRVIQSDWWAVLAVVFPAVFWLIPLVLAIVGTLPDPRGRAPLTKDAVPLFLLLAALATLVGIPALIWRWRSFQALFSCGVEVRGRITKALFFRGRGRVEYEYEYDGEEYHGGNAVQKTRRTDALQPGVQVVLLVDPRKPNRALVRDLYI